MVWFLMKIGHVAEASCEKAQGSFLLRTSFRRCFVVIVRFWRTSGSASRAGDPLVTSDQ